MITRKSSENETKNDLEVITFASALEGMGKARESRRESRNF